MLLSHSDLPILGERLKWIKEHPHPTLQAIVAIGQNQISLRADLCRRFKYLLENGILTILICDLTGSQEQIILQLLSALKLTGLFHRQLRFGKTCCPSASVETHPSNQSASVIGSPSLRRRQDCFALTLWLA